MEELKPFLFLCVCLFFFKNKLLKDKIKLEIGFQHSSIGCKCSGKKLSFCMLLMEYCPASEDI